MNNEKNIKAAAPKLSYEPAGAVIVIITGSDIITASGLLAYDDTGSVDELSW